MCIHPYALLDSLDLVHEFHLCHPPDVLELPDRPDHRQRKTETARTEAAGTEAIKGGGALRARPPLLLQ